MKIIQQLFIDWLIDNGMYNDFVKKYNNHRHDRFSKYNLYEYLNYINIYFDDCYFIFDVYELWDCRFDEYYVKTVKQVCKLEKI